jgi:hypothetical protein
MTGFEWLGLLGCWLLLAAISRLVWRAYARIKEFNRWPLWLIVIASEALILALWAGLIIGTFKILDHEFDLSFFKASVAISHSAEAIAPSMDRS